MWGALRTGQRAGLAACRARDHLPLSVVLTWLLPAALRVWGHWDTVGSCQMLPQIPNWVKESRLKESKDASCRVMALENKCSTRDSGNPDRYVTIIRPVHFSSHQCCFSDFLSHISSPSPSCSLSYCLSFPIQTPLTPEIQVSGRCLP
uniref:Uncharacterized protein n=1 Tax=Myotis myotis TaxID=51298 RepID=A0A7J8AMF0_MYOMY|nr:hypothetical protein mMyoMyo1_007923 [Myotis myotis]